MPDTDTTDSPEMEQTGQQQAGEPEPAEDAAKVDRSATAAPTEPTTDAKPEGEAEAPKPDGPVAVPEKAQREIGRLAKALEARQREGAEKDDEIGKLTQQLDELRGQVSRASTADRAPAGPTDHPALQGRRVEEDGTVLVGDQYVPAAVLTQLHDLEKKVGELTGTVTADRQAAEDARSEAEIESMRNELIDATVDAISEMRGLAFPNLPDKEAEETDHDILVHCDDLLKQALKEEDKLSADIVLKAAAESVEWAKRRFGQYADRQLKDNADYKDKHKVKPGAQTGTPPVKSVHQMTRREREAAADEAARLAEGMRPTESG